LKQDAIHSVYLGYLGWRYFRKTVLHIRPRLNELIEPFHNMRVLDTWTNVVSCTMYIAYLGRFFGAEESLEALGVKNLLNYVGFWEVSQFEIVSITSLLILVRSYSLLWE